MLGDCRVGRHSVIYVQPVISVYRKEKGRSADGMGADEVSLAVPQDQQRNGEDWIARASEIECVELNVPNLCRVSAMARDGEVSRFVPAHTEWRRLDNKRSLKRRSTCLFL